MFLSGRKLSSTKAFVRIMKAGKTNYFCKVLAFALRIELTKKKKREKRKRGVQNKRRKKRGTIHACQRPFGDIACNFQP